MTDLFLAVDLDGTFLGGSEQQRRRLYELLAAHRPRVTLAFVTGRDIPFASGLPADGDWGLGGAMPVPDLIIGDVGTSVVVGPDWQRHAELEAWIDSRWPGTDAAAAIMARHPALRLQEVFGGRRLSYFYDDQAAADAAAAEIADAGYDAVTSAGLFFDVLPRGVNKGTTLRRVLRQMGVPDSRVLVAGDTLNDLSMFATGLNGVAVGNAEAPLLAALDAHPGTYRATAHGAGGILEALDHFDLNPARGTTQTTKKETAA